MRRTRTYLPQTGDAARVLGLQIAAQEIADDLQKLGFCSSLGPLRSTSQWWKWARGKRI